MGPRVFLLGLAALFGGPSRRVPETRGPGRPFEFDTWRGGPLRACEARGFCGGRKAFCLPVPAGLSFFLSGVKTVSFPEAPSSSKRSKSLHDLVYEMSSIIASFLSPS